MWPKELIPTSEELAIAFLVYSKLFVLYMIIRAIYLCGSAVTSLKRKIKNYLLNRRWKKIELKWQIEMKKRNERDQEIFSRILMRCFGGKT